LHLFLQNAGMKEILTAPVHIGKETHMRKVRILKVHRIMTFNEEEIRRAEQNCETLIGERRSAVMYDRDGKMLSESEDMYDTDGCYLDSVTTQYTYDGQGRPVLERNEYSETTYEYGEDEHGNSVKKTRCTSFICDDDYESTETVRKDDMGRIVWEHCVQEGIEDVFITSEYGEDGRLKKRVYESNTGTSAYEYEHFGERTVERKTTKKENGEDETTLTETVDSGEVFESVTVRESDGREIERRVVKRIKNSLGKWFPSEVTCMGENGVRESERYEYFDPECELFKLTSYHPQDGYTEVSEYDAVYWDQPAD